MGREIDRTIAGAMAWCVVATMAPSARCQDTERDALAAEAVPPTNARPSVPPLTPVEIAIDVELGSKASKTGQLFPFHLAKPILLDGVVVIPAGTTGQGEVIHAKKGGGSGAPGELVLTARYLQIGGRQLRLRSLRLEAIGNDRMGTVNAINTAAAATMPVAGLIGFFVTGGDKVLAVGTVLPAKTAEAFVPDLPTSSTAPKSAPMAPANKVELEVSRGKDAASDGGGTS